MPTTELTAEEIEAKKQEELKASSLAKEKVTQATSTSPPKDPSTDLTDVQRLKIFDIQQKTVREQGARLSATERELAELKLQKEEAAKPTIEEAAKAFYANPAKMIEEALEKAIAPLNAFKDRFESDSEYDRIKKGLMSNPIFAQHLSNPQFAQIVDEIVLEGQRTGAAINKDSVVAVIKHTIGEIAVGDIVINPVKGTEVEGKTDLETKEGDKVIPPYLQPSSPPQKKKSDEKHYRDLTENEARLARERGMTKEQYLDWQEIDPSEVIDSKIGIPPKKEGG